jgi:hypothetical protein
VKFNRESNILANVDIWDYFHQKEVEFESLSLSPHAEGGYSAMFYEESGSDGRRGRILGELDLTARVKLCITESVVVFKGSFVHRERYAYYLVVDGEEVWGFDRDPSHPVAEHRHVGPDHGTGAAHERMTFKQVADIAWDYVSQHSEELDDPTPGLFT